MRELSPPVRPSLLRGVLAVLFPLLVIVPLSGLAFVLIGVTQATYTIAGGSLVVASGDLFAGKRTVPLADVSEARPVTLRGGRRTAGTALPGYCAGRFSYPDLGAVWQLTDCGARGVLLRATGEPLPIVLTPPDPEGFLARLHAGTETRITLPPPDKGPLRLLGLIVVPAGVVTSLLVAALMRFGPGRMRYRVGDGTFEVRTLFGRKSWPTAGARARGYTPGRMWRMAGTAAPGYYTGLFREDGKTTRVYATHVDRVVLFEGPARVLVSPEDPVELLRLLEAEGVTIEHHA